MEATGIICEYNPLHLGHKKQLDTIKAIHPDGGIVCLMSGNYVQRGAPAIIDKSLRAKAAILSGADLVLELPVTASLSSAEGFAREGVRILGGFCKRLCFGVESADTDSLLTVAKALLSTAFPEALHNQLEKGFSFPAARQAALLDMGIQNDTLTYPNDILATEYCKAILQQGCAMKPMPIARNGNYHDIHIDEDNPSATALRDCMHSGKPWQALVPKSARSIFENAALHKLVYGEQAILYRLRTMTDAEYEVLPYGSEGLWRKLMHASRIFGSLEEILAATKSKRYTRTRLDRMVMCAFLGIEKKVMDSPAPYARVLAFNDTGRQLLKIARQNGAFPNTGESVESSYQSLEYNAERLYSLFCKDRNTAPGQEDARRVYYHHCNIETITDDV